MYILINNHFSTCKFSLVHKRQQEVEGVLMTRFSQVPQLEAVTGHRVFLPLLFRVLVCKALRKFHPSSECTFSIQNLLQKA